jgi:hypothetical protein
MVLWETASEGWPCAKHKSATMVTVRQLLARRLPPLPQAPQDIAQLASPPTWRRQWATWNAVAATGWKEGQGHFGHLESLILVKLGPVLHKYSGPCYNVIREKPNVEFSFQISPTLVVPFFK